MLSSLWKLTKVPIMVTSGLMFLKNVLAAYMNLWSICFYLSIEKGIFLDDLKIVQATPLYKADDKSDLSNYRPISVLSCFLKILELMMDNRLYQYFIEIKILYPKQFGFQTVHSTEHAIVQLLDQILESFEYNKNTLGVFIDPYSRPFSTS